MDNNQNIAGTLSGRLPINADKAPSSNPILRKRRDFINKRLKEMEETRRRKILQSQRVQERRPVEQGPIPVPEKLRGNAGRPVPERLQIPGKDRFQRGANKVRSRVI